MFSWLWRFAAIVFLGCSLALTGCGGSGGGGTTSQAPVVGTQPASSTLLEGSAATLSVVATGSGTLTYQWQRDGVDIAGATAASYQIPSVSRDDNGAQFRVVVTNAAGAATSSVATLTVTPANLAAVIVSQPVGITVAPGTPANFRVVADGTTPVGYQWQRDGVDISGATAATYTLASAQAADSGASFQVVVSNTLGSAISDGALLTVDANVVAVSIVTQPQAVTVVDGSSATFSVAATGTGPFSYQWRRNGADIFGGTGNTLSTPSLRLSDSGAVYAVVVTNGVGSVTSADATATVNARPVEWVAQPSATSVAQGQAATFTASVSGSQPVTYQWQRNGASIAGATAQTYTTPATTLADDGALYSLVATNAAASITSATARLSVQATAVAPGIATAPESVTVSEGQVANFSVSATGTAPLAYQWRRNDADIAGATTATYATAATTAADNGARFSVRVSNAAGSVTSSEAVLTVQAGAGVLVGRAWSSGQQLEADDNPVRDRFSGIDDSGRVTAVFRKSNGTRDVIYATRGTPNASGAAPSWSAPVVIDELAGSPVSTMGTQPAFNLAVSPAGNVLVWWYHRAPCTAATYLTTSTCRFQYMARFSAANSAWSAPELIGDAPGLDFQGVINDRGDMALVGTSWIRSGTNRYTDALALFSRSASQSTLNRQLLNAVPLEAVKLDMDASGNLLLAAEAQQNATTDLVAYRGTAGAGLGAQEVLDTRSAAASFMTAKVGINGQQVVVWQQSDGSATSVWAATSATATGSWAVQSLGALRTFGFEALTVADNGDALLLNRYEGWRWGWGGGAWVALSNLPANTPTSVFLDCAHARNGNFLCVAADAFGEGNTGRWATYDASRNVMVQPLASTASGYVLGVNTINRGVGYEQPPLLSVNGIGATTMLNTYDVLPSQTVPAGDARTVKSLWGIYLK